MKTVYLGFLGCGNIGGGVYHLLTAMRGEIARRDGLDLVIRRALVKSIPEARTDVPREILTEDAEDIFRDPEISIVCEFMGGERPAADFMRRALEAGKTVVTANKMALALRWDELQQAAEASGAGLYFEASVGGVIPIIRTLTVSLEADSVHQLMGIVNGTTNYILTRMAREGSDYAAVLADAQRLGLAEPNPEADVEGMDAAFKLSIMSSIAFHGRVTVDKVYREGITRVTGEDIAFGREMGYTLKLLAIGKREGDTVEVRVHPTFLPASHPLAQVDGSLNAIFLHGDYCQDMMLQGRGAGDKPTASAICGDVLFAARGQQPIHPSFRNTAAADSSFRFTDNWVTRAFLRLRADDQPGILAGIASCFSAENVSIATMLQKGAAEDGQARLVLITHPAPEQSLRRAIARLDGNHCVCESFIRVEE